MNYYLLFRLNIFLYYIKLLFLETGAKNRRLHRNITDALTKGKEDYYTQRTKWTLETLGEQDKGGSIDNLTDRD